MTAAAAACNLHRTTLYHWIRTQPDFSAGIRDARTECYRDWCERRQEMHDLAWSTLRSLLVDPNTPASVRLRAALAVLKNGFNSPELDEAGLNLEKSVESVENVESAKRTHAAQTARNAPCPCGSGIKFKRCCGRGAPPLLHLSDLLTLPRMPVQRSGAPASPAHIASA